MRKIPLTAKRFEIVYDGLLNSPRGVTAPSETRIMGKILDKMEALAHQETVDGVPTFRMNGDVVSPDLEVTDEEYTLIIESLKAIKWMGRGARVVSELFDALEKVPVT